MPPVAQRNKESGVSADKALTLFAQNLDELRRWYRSMDAGRDMGHNVLAELMLANVSLALSLALVGKRWDRSMANNPH